MFLARNIETYNFNPVCIIGEIGGDLESDLSHLQNSLHGDERKYYPRKKIKQGQTAPWKLSAHRRMIYIREFKI